MVRSISAVSAVALALALLAAGGCSGGSRTHGSTAAAPFTIAQQREPMSLNPALENGTSSTEWGELLFSYMVKYDDRGQLIPDAATDVPSLANGGISRDGLTITYHLRRGLRWADGKPLTAQDCVWSVNAIDDRANNVQSRYGYDVVHSAQAPDPYTCVLHLTRPFAPLLTLVFAPQGFPILPKHLLARYPNFNNIAFDGAPIGSGPYVATRWIRGDRVELRANPYYRGGPPKIAHLDIRFVPDPQTAIGMLRTHEAQGYVFEQDYANFPILRSIPGVRTTSTPVNAVGAIIFNTQDPRTSDPRVRHALAEAINIKELVAKTYRGALTSANAGRGLFIWAYDASAYPDIPYDPAHARALLDQAGWRMGPDGVRHKNGRALDLLFIIQAATPGDAIIGNTVTQYERAVGAHVTLKAFNITQFVAPANEGGPVYGGKFQMALYPFVNGDDPDTTDQFACRNIPPHGYNKSRICDPRIDALLAAGRTTYDRARRIAIYSKLQRLLYGEMPIALLYQVRQINAFTDRLKGQTTSLSGAFWNVGAWTLASTRRQTARIAAAPRCAVHVFPPSGRWMKDTLHGGPGLVLSGGGFGSMPHPPVFAWMRDHVLPAGGRAGNLVILKASDNERYYSDPFYKEGRFASVREIFIPPCANRAQTDAVAPYVDGADYVLFAGGDQAHYVKWKGGKLIAAVRRLYARGGVVGGGSAGLAIQGAVVFDSVSADRLLPSDQDVATPDAVKNPYEPSISFTTHLFDWPPLRDAITDTHVARRNRFGRMTAFMARALQDGLVPGNRIYGVAVDEGSALLVDARGVATLHELPVESDGYRTKGAWIVRGGRAARIAPGKPLLYTVGVTHLNRDGMRYDLRTHTGAGVRYTVTVNGAAKRIYDPPDPYTGP